jgi:hypothetical protein
MEKALSMEELLHERRLTRKKSLKKKRKLNVPEIGEAH